MFVTLRSRAGGPGDGTAMEQVSIADGRRLRGSCHRSACLECSSKKLRCTGAKAQCDRCSERDLNCVFPPKVRRSRKRQRSEAAQGPRPTTSLVPGPDIPVAAGTLVNSNESMGLPAALPGLQPLTAGAVSTDDIFSDNSLQKHLESENNQLSTPSLELSSNDTPQNMTDSADRHSLSAPRAANATCSCIDHLLETARKLDDDEFQLSCLNFSQVLQVQKWLMFQCCRPLDCTGCARLPVVHTTLLMVCTKISDIFSCLAKRIHRIQSKRTAMGVGPDVLNEDTLAGTWYMPSSQEQGDVSPRDHRLRNREPLSPLLPQIFDSITGRSGFNVDCNPEMFATEFCTGHSEEEQLLMVRALIKVQVRNFGRLLARIDSMDQSSQNQARSAKIRALAERLANAAAGLESGMDKILETVTS